MSKIFFAQLENLNVRSAEGSPGRWNTTGTNAYHRTAASRGDVILARANTLRHFTDPFVDPETGLEADLDDFWCMVALGAGGTGFVPAAGNSRPFLMLVDSSLNCLWGIMMQAATGFLQIVKYPGNTQYTGLTGFTVQATSAAQLFAQLETRHLAVRVKLALDGFIRVYRDGALWVEFVGDTRTASGTNLVRRLQIESTDSAATGSMSSTSFSEIVVADFDLRFAMVATHYPTAAGDTNTMDAGTYADVDENGVNDADGLVANAAGREFTCATSDMPANGTLGLVQTQWKIRGVVAAARMSAGATGPQNGRAGVKTAGGVATGPVTNLSNGYAIAVARFGETNPTTGVAWTAADLNALQAYVKSEA